MRQQDNYTRAPMGHFPATCLVHEDQINKFNLFKKVKAVDKIVEFGDNTQMLETILRFSKPLLNNRVHLFIKQTKLRYLH